MYRSINSDYGMQSEMAYQHSFYDPAHGGRRDLRMPNELDVASTTELAPTPARGVTLHGKRSAMAWAPSPAMVSATPQGHYGRPQNETWITTVYRGLRSIGTDGVAAVVATLALCFFIGLAIWFMSAVQDQWDGNGLDSADDSDAGLHVDVYGAEPSSPVAGVHDKIPKIDWKITLGTRRPRNSKTSLITTEIPAMAPTSPAIVLSAGDVGDPESPDVDGDESHQSDESEDGDDSMAPLTFNSSRHHCDCWFQTHPYQKATPTVQEASPLGETREATPSRKIEQLVFVVFRYFIAGNYAFPGMHECMLKMKIRFMVPSYCQYLTY
ncbi:hypothetical protein MTO96_022182 [Rhipicephalus appendiculatus]